MQQIISSNRHGGGCTKRSRDSPVSPSTFASSNILYSCDIFTRIGVDDEISSLSSCECMCRLLCCYIHTAAIIQQDIEGIAAILPYLPGPLDSVQTKIFEEMIGGIKLHPAGNSVLYISYGRGRSRPFCFQVLLHPCLHIVLAMYSEFIGIHMIACHHVLQLHTCPYTVVNLLACCPNT
jgi:hypothetical protein